MQHEFELALRPKCSDLVEPFLDAELFNGRWKETIDESAVGDEIQRHQIADRVGIRRVVLQSETVEDLLPVMHLEQHREYV